MPAANGHQLHRSLTLAIDARYRPASWPAGHAYCSVTNVKLLMHNDEQ